MALEALRALWLGITLAIFRGADVRIHELLADPKRRRQRQSFSPPQRLS